MGLRDRESSELNMKAPVWLRLWAKRIRALIKPMGSVSEQMARKVGEDSAALGFDPNVTQRLKEQARISCVQADIDVQADIEE
jgi:hypothetical protein